MVLYLFNLYNKKIHMDIFSQDFDHIRDEYRKAIEDVRNAFEEMVAKYIECDKFSNDVLRKKNWEIDDSQKNRKEST